MMKKRRKAFLIFILSALMVLTCAPDVFAEDVSASGTDSETSGLDPMSVNDVMITISPDIGTQDVLYTNTAYSYTVSLKNNTEAAFTDVRVDGMFSYIHGDVDAPRSQFIWEEKSGVTVSNDNGYAVIDTIQANQTVTLNLTVIPTIARKNDSFYFDIYAWQKDESGNWTDEIGEYCGEPSVNQNKSYTFFDNAYIYIKFDPKAYKAGDEVTVTYDLELKDSSGAKPSYNGFTIDTSIYTKNSALALEYVRTNTTGMIAGKLGANDTKYGAVRAGNQIYGGGGTNISDTGELFSITYRVPADMPDGTFIRFFLNNGTGNFSSSSGGTYISGGSYGFTTGIANPVFTEQPEESSQYAIREPAAPLKANATIQDSGTLTYQWYAGIGFPDDEKKIAGATGPSYTPSTKHSGIYHFYCVATNTSGDLSCYCLSDIGEIYIPEVPVTFADVSEGSWYYNSVKFVLNNSIMTGLNDTDFGAGDTLKRAHFATIIYRLENEPPVTYTRKFADVDDDKFYSLPVIWTSNVGIVTGYNSVDGALPNFGPSDNITREQIAVMLYRYAKYRKLDTSVPSSTLSSYPDAGNISPFAKEAMDWAVYNGLISGNKDGYLNPHDNAIRAECAAILSRFLGKFSVF